MRAELHCILDQAQTLAHEELCELLGELETIRLIAHGRLASPAVTAKPGEVWLDVAEVAARMHKSRDFIYRHAKDWPFARRLGKGYLFSASGLDSFLKKSR
jgi:hypothetical protein